MILTSNLFWKELGFGGFLSTYYLFLKTLNDSYILILFCWDWLTSSFEIPKTTNYEIRAKWKSREVEKDCKIIWLVNHRICVQRKIAYFNDRHQLVRHFKSFFLTINRSCLISELAQWLWICSVPKYLFSKNYSFLSDISKI